MALKLFHFLNYAMQANGDDHLTSLSLRCCCHLRFWTMTHSRFLLMYVSVNRDERGKFSLPKNTILLIMWTTLTHNPSSND
jgi:hypothetical protein